MPRWVLALVLAAVPAWAAPPLPESSTGRRAVRGVAVDVARESDELRQLREFEEQSFPPPFPGALSIPRSPGDDDGEGEPARAHASSLTNGVGPDALPAPLRSPEHELAKPVDAPSAIPWLDQLKLPDLPVRFDPRVVRYLEFYKSDKHGRAIMTSWLKKQGRWKALFEEALRRAHLPLSLINVSMIESGYDPLDRSHAGAVGLWQFMPDNSRIYGLRVDYWVDDRRNPEKATAAWVHYIGDLKERFGAWPLTLAAFNAGYGAVLRAMQKYNTNDYWELCKHEDGLPWETTLYVPKAMAVAIVGENRARFGYDAVTPDPPYAFDRALVPTSMSVAAIAKAAGVAVAEVAALNPDLRRSRTPPELWEVRLPRGSGPRFAAAYQQHKELVKPFIVRFGERLDDLAAANGLTTRELRVLNGIDDSTEIRPGLTLVVPAGRQPLPIPPCETVIVAVPDKDAIVAGKKRLFYRTLPQDAPADIATFFKVKPIDLAKWNNIDLEAKLAGGMVLQLWVASDFDTAKAALVDPARVRVVTTGSSEFFDLVEARRGRKRVNYVVKTGDDLKRVGKKFNLTVADLERINRFSAAHTELTVGQKLMVYVPMTAAEKAKAACAITPSGGDGGEVVASQRRAPVGGELEQARHALEKISDDGDTESPPGHEAAALLDDGDRPAPTTAVVEDRLRGLPRPPPSDGRP
jgi:membrane-bound lytic murein transglycosylase D